MIPPQAKRFLALVAVLCFSSFNHATAQQNTDLLVFNVSVTDEKGRTYRGLKPENFSASVDKAPRNIISLTADNQPLSVGLLVDVSRSVGPLGTREAQKFWRKLGDSAAGFLKASNPENDYFALMFDSKVGPPERWTGPDISVLSKLSPPGNHLGTAFFDALYSGIQNVMSGRHSKRALLMITDGQDSNSKRTFNEVVSLLKRSDVIVYAIGLLTDEDAGSALGQESAGVLDELTGLTGGRVWFLSPRSKPEAFNAAFEWIASDLQNQYQLSIEKQVLPGPEKFRKLRLKLDLPKEKGRPKLYVRSRDGYYQ
jgi:Ca-activated chloride channel family protein